jgi:lysophospholipase L1-like esterase
MPQLRRSRRRRLLTAGLSVAVSLTVLAAGLEVGARLFVTSPFGAEGELVGMYENAEEPGSIRTVPGWEGSFTVEGRTVPVRLNRLGLRSPEIGPRQPDELRVLCLGDSFVFGYGVTAEEAFPGLLGELLPSRLGRPVVTGNAGVPGYGTVEQAHCLARIGPAVDADVIVCSIYLGNDFIDDQHVTKYVEGGFSMTGEWASLLRRSARARLMLLSRAWMRFEIWLMEAGSRWALQPTPTEEEARAFAGFPPRARPNQCVAGLFMDVIDDQRSWDPADPQPVVPRVLSRTAESLTALRASAGEARLLVAILPSWWHVHEEDRQSVLREVGLDPDDFQPGLTQQRLLSLCAELGLAVVDLTPTIAALPDPSSAFLPENRHLSVAGHRLVAEVLAGEIARLVD